MRRVGVVSVARSDYGIYRPVLRAMQCAPDLELHLIASGAHLSPEFGCTISEIEADGFAVAERIEMLLSSNSPEGVAKSVGLGVIGFAQIYARVALDLLLVLGDRFEMYAAALAALPFRIPVAHVHGGEVTEGAIDEALRHSLTKLSHLHFVSTEEYGRRVVQLGEEPWRVAVSGSPALDNLSIARLVSRPELATRLGISPEGPLLLVTYHPVTLAFDQAEQQTAALLGALGDLGIPTLFTMPNADTGGRVVRKMIHEYACSRPDVWAVENLGTELYFSVMAVASAMVGNSSSGIIEAGSFELPVVNVGIRQRGRTRGPNVVDVSNEREAILAGMRTALDPSFRRGLRGMKNSYGTGRAAERIVERLRSVPLDERLIVKRFFDLDQTVGT